MRTVIRHVVTVRVVIAALIAILIAIASYFGYCYYLLQNQLAQSDTVNSNLVYQFGQLNDKLIASNTENDNLKTLLQAKVQESEAAGAQVLSLTTTVGTLDKIVNTDKELLEKYSSVYFLSENYVPKNLLTIDTKYLNRPDKPEQVLTGIYGHLTDMLNAAQAAGVPLQVLSAYRSFGTQANLKSTYKVSYGAGTANSFSADQGYSEHQLGTALDFTTPAIGAPLTGFDKTPSYAWMQNNAYKYGFNLSYPKGNTHFVFEPWHWRYVGVELATKLHDNNQALYDMDQRDIDSYLVKFFD